MSKFSERLRLLRAQSHLSQKELADCLGLVSKSSINMYERGEREPSFETLEAIADFFNVDMDYLMGKSSVPNYTQLLMQSVGKEASSGRTPAAERISKLMRVQNLSCADLSRLTGIPESALQRYVTGITPEIPAGEIKAVSSALRVSPAYLMGWEDNDGFLDPNVVAVYIASRTGASPLEVLDIINDNQMTSEDLQDPEEVEDIEQAIKQRRSYEADSFFPEPSPIAALFDLPPDERELVSIFRGLNAAGKKRLLETADDMLQSGKYKDEANDKTGGIDPST